jgi:quercetin dioxygenase-like cupin family protein
MPQLWTVGRSVIAACIYSAFAMTPATFAQESPQTQGCRPIAERTTEVGCWIITHTELGTLPGQTTFWHLNKFATRAAAEAAKGKRGTVVESLGQVWLFTIDAPGSVPTAGTHVAKIGPIPVRPGVRYTALYMEAIFTPGMTTRAHRHSGAEAWHTISGETCLETSEGKMIGRPGNPIIVREGLPMHLTATGTETRRSLVLILHDSTQPPITLAPDWQPKGLCNQPD